MGNFIKFIPNLLTLANLACGLVGIMSVFSGDYELAAYMVAGSLVFDFLDGLVARALGVHSELGLQLDSLADVVSFGVSPGFLMFMLMEESTENLGIWHQLLPYFAFLIPLFSALRLAKFNIDTRQTSYFIGLPTPSNAILHYSIALWMIYTSNDAVKDFLTHPVFLSLLVVVSSILLVAELPLMALKLKSRSWRDNLGQILLIAIFLILLLWLGFPAFVFIIPLYLLLSLIFKPNRE